MTLDKVALRAGTTFRWSWLAWPVLGIAFLSLAVPWPNETYAFWSAWDAPLYEARWLDPHVYIYSPAVAQAWWPWTLLPWPLASAVWNLGQLAALVYMVGPVLAALLFWVPWLPAADYLNPVQGTLSNGNPMIFLALAIYLGRRWPVAWAFVLLTKVTPGVGLLWFAVRREWRNLALALGATAAIVAVSFALAPSLWPEWFTILRDATGADASRVELLYIPLAVRLPLAAAVVTWGAWTDRYWTVPIGAMLALPAIALGGFAVGVAAIAVLRSDAVHAEARGVVGTRQGLQRGAVHESPGFEVIPRHQ